jgi:hypothetical protein
MFECLAVFKRKRTRAKSSKSIFQVSDRTLPASVNTILIMGAKVRFKYKFYTMKEEKMQKGVENHKFQIACFFTLGCMESLQCAIIIVF